MRTTLAFPLHVDQAGRVTSSGGDAAIRGQIIQVLFTAPGERVNLPEFGCGLFNLVFEPNDPTLAAAMEFMVGQALAQWMGDTILVNGVQVASAEETITIEIVYTNKRDLSTQAVRMHFR